MNGFCRAASGFGYSFGGAAGGSAEEKGDLFGGEDFEEGAKECCFSYAGTAGEDHDAVSEDGGDCLNLCGRQRDPNFLLAPFDGFRNVHRRVADGTGG